MAENLLQTGIKAQMVEMVGKRRMARWVEKKEGFLPRNILK